MTANLIELQRRFLGDGETIYDRLVALKEARGGLAVADIDALSDETGVPASHIRALVQFYDDLRMDPALSRTGSRSVHGPQGTRHVRLCNGEACTVAGGREARERMEAALSGATPSHVTCLGYCGSGPNAIVEQPDGPRVVSLLEEGTIGEMAVAISNDEPIDRAEPQNAIFPATDPKANILLRHEPGDVTGLEAAEAAGIYGAFRAALTRGPDAVLAALEASRLRGRGGAGFPAARKLATARDAPAPRGRVVVCNADEGDAGAYIDKELLERDPHSVIEGMLLAAFAIGAGEGVIYLRSEYPRAHAVVQRAMAEAAHAGLLGASIAGSDFCFDLKFVKGQGAYICGEETSLLRSLEGAVPLVSAKPPFPAISGLRGAPTAVHNVETLAVFPWIMQHGGEAYAALGVGKSRGTKLVSLNAAVARPGLYEVELGTTLRTVLFDLAGGMAGGKGFKAVQVGGPLGGILAERHLDLPLGFEELAEAGGTLGHAGMVVYADDVDLVRIGQDLMRFCAVESCGKCFPCRIGSVRGDELFAHILAGQASQDHLELLAELSETMRLGSLCALGGAVPTPIDHLLTWFIDEFEPYIPGARIPSRLSGQSEAAQ